jgi:hypothetical protein
MIDTSILENILKRSLIFIVAILVSLAANFFLL